MVTIRIVRRPILSARIPKRIPPTAAATKVMEVRNPPAEVERSNSRISAGRTIAYKVMSMPSSIQPRPLARRARRSTFDEV